MGGLDLGAELPEESDEFPCDGDFDFIVMELAFAQHVEAVTETHLGRPGKFLDPGGSADLAL